MNKKKEASKSKYENICFVIMPFRGWSDSYYSEIYIPAINNAGLTPRRADDIFRPGIIVKDIWELTKTAEIILADLSGQNPNVFYELGLAHAIAKPVILITESIDDVPFDLQSLRIINYNKNKSNWGEILQENITQSITEAIEDPTKSILSTFLDVDESARPKISSVEKDIAEIRQDIASLQRIQHISGRYSQLGTQIRINFDGGSKNIPFSMFTDLSGLVYMYLDEGRTKDDISQKIMKEYSFLNQTEAEGILSFFTSDYQKD